MVAEVVLIDPNEGVRPEVATADGQQDCCTCPHYIYGSNDRLCKRRGKLWKVEGECQRCGRCCSMNKCEHLVFRGNQACCTVYENRKESCRMFPTVDDFLADIEDPEPPCIPKGCGYRLVEVEFHA